MEEEKDRKSESSLAAATQENKPPISANIEKAKHD